MTHWDHPDVAAWESTGTYLTLTSHQIFVVDIAPSASTQADPLLIIHGFPTSSFDYAAVLSDLSRDRRVILDLLGYGLSAKPDEHYTMAKQADVVMALTTELGIERLALLTHDMGDTVGGELLARQMEGRWPVEITCRILTNGSIYIEMAHLTAGQQFLLSLPDEIVAIDAAPDRTLLAASLTATLAPDHSGIDMASHAELIEHLGGNRLLARTIRYIEERRANERRFTGAIESHPSPLTIVWGPEDPIAVADMPRHLKTIRPEADNHWIAGAGHYPQIEDPTAFVEVVVNALA